MSTEPPVSGLAKSPAPQAGVRLEVRNLEVRLGAAGPDVVKDVSFGVPAGEVLGIVGESGSGKTTVALALLGHARRGLSIRSGQVRLDGVDLLRLRPAQLRAVRGAKVAYVPQDPASALNPALRIGTQLTEALRVHPGIVDDPAGRIAEVMREASLEATPEMLRRYPHQLSGGQQQRVSLAMAFSCRPSLIVLDEPTTGLDVSTQRHVLDTVRSLCRSYGVAAVYVSHDLAVVGGLVANVAVMYAGKIIEIGPTAEAVRRAGASLYPRAARGRALTRARGTAHRHRRTAAAARTPRVRLLVRSAMQLRSRPLQRAGARGGQHRRPDRPVPAGSGDRGRRCLPSRGRSQPGCQRGLPRSCHSADLSASYGQTPVLFAVGTRRARRVMRRGGRRVRLRQDHARSLHRRDAPVTGPVT